MIYATKEINKIYLKSFFNQNREKKKNLIMLKNQISMATFFVTILKQLRLFL